MQDIATPSPIVISMGDPAGVGPEIIGKAWEARSVSGLQPFFVVGDIDCFPKHWHGNLAKIGKPDECPHIFEQALPILDIGRGHITTAGIPNTDGAGLAFEALEIAVGLTRQGVCSAIVTAPISKAQMYSVGFRHPGQTEFVAERCGVSSSNATMMLAAPDLRVVPMTTHIPIAAVAKALTAQLIEDRIRATHDGLIRNFAIPKPRLALAGLNPHAGESGNIGRKEVDVMIPLLEQLRAEGMDISGPLSADTLFHRAARAQYDAAICAYHDQALIPIKTLYFDEAVNLTLGLPIIRTSPDHGTAFNIAGKGIANPASMIAAIQMASDCATHRAAYDTAHERA